jgi:hypothetical protein
MLACYCNEHDYCNAAEATAGAAKTLLAAATAAVLLNWIRN